MTVLKDSMSHCDMDKRESKIHEVEEVEQLRLAGRAQ